MLNAKEYLSLAILIFGASMTSADVLDFTIVVNSAVVDANDEVNFGGYLHKSEESTSIFLGQNILTETDSNENEVEWTDGDNPPIVLDNSFFPTGTSLGTETTSEYQALIMKMPNSSGIAKVGSFYGKAMAQNKEEFIPFVILNSNATVVPKYRSLTASIGDDLTGLIMVTSYGTGSYRWRHNGGNVITSYNGKSNLELTNVRMADAGVYECYLHETGRDGRHAIIQINVKGCSKRKWGTDCDLNCPVCYNGGICDHITGLCICAAGFEGVDCSKGCESSNWGRECSINSLTEHIGKTFCPPHPLSCSCYAGYTGHVCDQECILGMYGPDCACVCHCPTNVCDRHKGCAEDSVCHLGYAGKTCLEHLSCPPGMFGEFCQYTCHCESKKTDIIAGCDKHTGECLNDVSCSSGWGGSDCQIALPILKRNPTTSVTENSITISWEPWRSSIDYGTGPVIKYQVIYRTPPNSGFPFIVWREVNVDDLMRVDIDDLEPRTNYEIRIILHRQIDGENYTSIGSSKIVVTSGEDKIMDFTFYCATPRVDVDDNTMSTFIGGYSGSDHQTSDIQIGKIVTEIGEDFLGREITWNDGSRVGVILGNETMFPVGTRVQIATPKHFNALRVYIDSASGVNKLGVFYAKANKLQMCSYISSEIVLIVLSKHASVMSVRKTWTTGTGERVMMNMVGDNSTDKWWRHNGITLNEWNNSLFIKIDVVRKQDAGIYECLPTENWENGNKGITNLIVRECPLRKWGPPDCLRNCPTCYNGGACDDVTGACVCTVGFRGINCEIACGSDTFGRYCSIICSSKDIESCMRKVMCPPSPQGCSCTDGYTGPDCLDGNKDINVIMDIL
ncbi:uncharacterized protein [Antedon mediterranea]|uniref:uncharacterized protein n=1 Tax=Antedon mediterranea TaxID=105859 RepID=UPI003AF70407